MKKKKIGWLILGILSSIVACLADLTVAGGLAITLFLYLFVGNGTIDGNAFSLNGVSSEGIIIFIMAVLSTTLAIFSIRKYKR